jgi:hypothetical protein
MERAFELDPYNRAIQDELSELYAARDGYSRERIELNRAALARLYFRSAMYGKAAAELTRLLKKRPERLDLKILLADALFWDGGRSDVVEVCLGIVEEMPYCIKANAILAAAWMRSSRPMEAEEHWRRVQSLTLMTAGSIDPDSTLGRALNLGDGLGLPQEVVVEDLDELAAATRQSYAMDDLAAERAGDLASGDQIPGWLHEIGFTAVEEVESEEEEELAFQSVPEPIDDDWLDEVALAAGLGLIVEERLRDESADDEIFSDQLVAMVDEIEPDEPEPDFAEIEPELFDLLENELDLIGAAVVVGESESIDDAPVEATVELFEEDLTLADAILVEEELPVIEAEVVVEDPDGFDAAPVQEESSEFDASPIDESPTSFEREDPPSVQSPDPIIDEAFGTDFWEEPVISRETGQISDEYSDLQEDMTDLVEELQAQRKGGTSLLPDLDEVLEEQKKGSDWLDGLVEDSDVTDDLPEWLYETVGFTDQLPEVSEEESVDDPGFDKVVSEGHVENDQPAEVIGKSDSDAGDAGAPEQIDWGSEWPVIDDAEKDDDLPEWLLGADEVLEELPDEVSQGTADSWLQSKNAEAEDVGWLDELAPKDEAIIDRASGEKLILQEKEPPDLPSDAAQEMIDDATDTQDDELTWPGSANDEQDDNVTAEKSDDGG